MRKFTFVTTAGTLILGPDTNYVIESVEGLSTPPTMEQEQKAPYQDGTTYIDTLFQPREITIEGSINKPKQLSAINTAKDAMMRLLNPKNGQGWLTYEADGGVEKKIQAVGKVIFANKDSRRPFQKFQIQFRCNDPYWQSPSATSINLPTSSNSAESVINAATSNFTSVIQLANGDLFIAYRRASDGYLVSRTYTTSWSSESIINNASSEYPSVIQLANGDLFIAYIRVSDGYLVSRTYTTSWSSESIINNASSAYPSVIQLANGDIFIAYRRVSDTYLVSRTYTTSWSSESIINNASSVYPSVIQLADGDLFIAYKRSDTYLVSRTYTTSWSSESIINNAWSDSPSVIQLANGDIFIAYRRASDGYLVSKTSAVNWAFESILNTISSIYPSVIQLANSDIFIAYQKNSNNYIASVTRSVTPVNASVTGHVNTPIKVTLNGPSTNPRIINNDTLEYIRLDKTLATGDYFIVRTGFGDKSIELWEGGIKKNGLAYMDINSTFFDLSPGNNTVYYEDDAVASTATATMEWSERYIGT